MKVEIEDTPKYFRFRLVHGKRKTKWANYTDIAILGNKATASAYYLGSDKEFQIMDAADMLRTFAVTEDKGQD